ncbi:hypothetical protein EWM64_g10338 [Hericium alpestre]|uniref:Uncharacterized protein n=1 Tax=Hericium alpestre TaxID=135208 RepID=A0A4Y9ZGY0_9AGAM|nr:hypothetical protein EWM64_g10338 [Hericium alpestre]
MLFSFPPSTIPRSTTWTILQALDRLSPPPSDVSLDNLASMPSSGEIPIFLHGGIELPLSPSSSASSGSFEHADASSQESFEAPGTAGTFGPMPAVSVKPRHDSMDVGGAAVRQKPVRPELRKSSLPVTAIHDLELRISIQDSPPLDSAGPAACRISRSCSSPLLTENSRSSCNDSGEPLGPLPPSLHPCIDEEGQMLLMTPSQSLSTLPTPMFAPGSPALSMTPESSPDHRFARLRTAVQKGVSYVAARRCCGGGLCLVLHFFVCKHIPDRHAHAADADALQPRYEARIPPIAEDMA